jgi:hypothetical protein
MCWAGKNWANRCGTPGSINPLRDLLNQIPSAAIPLPSPHLVPTANGLSDKSLSSRFSFGKWRSHKRTDYRSSLIANFISNPVIQGLMRFADGGTLFGYLTGMVAGNHPSGCQRQRRRGLPGGS